MFKKITFFILAAMLLAASPTFAQGRPTVTGRVIDADSGKPIAGAGVMIVETEKFVSADLAGRFAIAAEVGETILVPLIGYKPAAYTVSKTGDHDIGDIALIRKYTAPGTAAFTGRVTDTDTGKPLPSFTVIVSDSRKITFTGSTGRFIIEAPVGDTIQFTLDGYATKSYTVSKEGDYDIGDIVLEKDTSANAGVTEIEIEPDPDWANDPEVLAKSRIVQGTMLIVGRVINADSGKPIENVSVTVTGTRRVDITDAAGRFTITADVGDTLSFDYFYYETETRIISKTGNHDIGDVVLKEIHLAEEDHPTVPADKIIALSDVTIRSSVAIARRTPVAVSTVGNSLIGEKAGARDFPEVLNRVPGVYVSRKGGGFGDSELRLRGFKQENVAVMVNGAPMNDMEHGGVYWSNWAGLVDVAYSVQVQRGLGAAKVSAPSVGGSVNIVTAGAGSDPGGFVSWEAGDHGFNKATFKVSTGQTEKGFEMTLLGGSAWGRGYVQGTGFTAWNWFANISQRIGKRHRLSFTGFGAPQQHDQRGRYDGLTLDGWDRARVYTDGKRPYRYNPSYGFTPSGEGKSVARNVYHKPQLSLNHLWSINDKSSLSTAVYASFGRGYGYSPIAHNTWNSQWYAVNNGALNMENHDADGTFNYDRIYAMNAGAATDTVMAMSRSVNDHNWYGLLSTYTTRFGEHIDFYGGVDFRHYTGMHSNTLDNLYGADYYIDDASRRLVMAENNPAAAETGFVTEQLHEGDIVVRNYKGYIMQEGVFAQTEYNRYPLSVFAAASVSNTGYRRRDDFYYGGDKSLSETVNFLGFTAKAGGNYNLDDRNNVFANIGYISRAPFFSGGVFLQANNSNITNPDAVNEKIFSMELGYGYRTSLADIRFNAYRTVWSDKTMTRGILAGSGMVSLNMAGVKAKHEGLELDFAIEPLTWLELTGSASLGRWRWIDRATGYFYDSDGRPVKSYNAATGVAELASGIGAADHARVTVILDKVKVGGSAQTTAALGAKFKPLRGLYIGVDMLEYANNYADWAFEARDIEQGVEKQYESPWKMPSALLFDLSAGYGFRLRGLKLTLSGNIFNLFDKAYLADATDGADHNAETAYGIFYGFGRTGSLKLKIDF